MASTQHKNQEPTNHLVVRQFAGIFLAACACLVFELTGCKSYNSVIQTWVGKSESELIANWGDPDLRNSFSNGEKIYTWIDQGKNQYGPYTCQKSMTINQKHTITKGTSRGCPSPSSVIASYSN